MRRQAKSRIAVLIVCLLLFTGGIWQFIRLRLDRGEIYPAYSSLRSDPLGCRALFESLNAIGLQIERNYARLHQRDMPTTATFLIFGAGIPQPLAYDDNEYAAIDEFVKDGGRLVVCLAPVQEATYTPPPGEESFRPAGGRRNPSGKKLPPGMNLLFMQSFLERQNLSVAHRALPQNIFDEDYIPALAVGSDSYKWIEPLPWHSSLHFTDLPDSWTVILERAGKPVMIERQLGKGTLLVATDSYFLSNEGLRRHRRPKLLSRMIGDRSHVVFDETHLGVVEEPGLATLARRYRLGPLAVAMLLIAALFIWRNAFPLVPPAADWKAWQQDQAASGRPAAEGFVYLLRKHVKPKKLLSACFHEWQRSAGQHRGVKPEDLDCVKRLVDDEEITKDPELIVQAYRRICQYLTTRKG